MRSLRLVVLLGLASCGVEATKPLTPASASKADAALVGTWVPGDGKDKGVFTVTARGATVRIEVVGDKEPMTFEGHVSVLAADLKVLNLRALEDGKAKGNYLFVRYALKADGSLETWLVNDKLVSAALNAGSLKGSRGQYGGVTLDEAPEKIVAFLLEAKRDEVFEKLATLKRK